MAQCLIVKGGLEILLITVCHLHVMTQCCHMVECDALLASCPDELELFLISILNFSDFDECTDTQNPPKCGSHSQCVNTQGSYSCACDRYYLPDVDAMSCTGVSREYV